MSERIILIQVPQNQIIELEFEYENHAGKVSNRRVLPRMLFLGKPGSPYYTELGWYLHAWDIDRKAERTFLLSKMKPKDSTMQTVGDGTYRKVEKQPNLTAMCDRNGEIVDIFCNVCNDWLPHKRVHV